MITIEDVLSAKQLNLDLKASTPTGGIHEVADLLKGDERVLDWNGLVENLKDGNSCLPNESGYGICIPHARTNCINSMVMAGGRSRQGIWFESSGIRVHYIFVIGVPAAMASDYLRIIGALARIFKAPESEYALRIAPTKQAFVDLLVAGEMV